MNKDRYRVLQNGEPVIFAGNPIIITGKERAQEWVDQHNEVMRRMFKFTNTNFTIEKVEE